MIFTTETLLSNVVFGTASGNYDGSSQLFYSDPVTAAGYYAGQGNLQTLTYRLQDFVGRITIQGSLNDLTGQAKWFDINSYGDGIETITGTHPVSVTGNFVWLRAKVELFDGGTIQAVTAAY